MRDDKVKSKTLDTEDSEKYYEKIVQNQLHQDIPDIEMVPKTPLASFNEEVKDLINMEVSSLDYNTSSSSDNLSEIKQIYSQITDSMSKLKEMIYNIICEDDGEYECYIEIKQDFIEIHSQFINRKILKKIDKLSNNWIIESSDYDNYSLKLTINYMR